MSENREVKSDVFSMLMQEKEYALQVYNVVNDSHYDDPEKIEITTLKKGISLSIRNDASIILDMNLNLYEHQSTYSPNMPLRSLIYLADILKPIVKDKDIFGRKIIKIPNPKFVVFYNGRENRPAVEWLKLSDAYEHQMVEPEMELSCTVYNINPGMNDDLLNKCKVLKEYMTFIERVRSNEKEKQEEPIKSAIEWCIENDILKDFLKAREEEVLKAMVIDMTFERREELIRRDEREEGRLEGRAEGRMEGTQRILIDLIKKKISKNKMLEQIADELEMEVDEIRNYYSLILENPEASVEAICEMLEK